MAVLNGDEIVDQTTLQVYATLVARGQYLCSVSTMYRILSAHGQVKERRCLARLPYRVVPDLLTHNHPLASHTLINSVPRRQQ